MGENEIIVTAGILAALGGALGARQSGAQGWKGAATILAAIAVTMAALTLLSIDNAFLSILSNIVVAGVVGGALRLTGKQISFVLLGSILFTAAATFLFSLFMPENSEL